MKLDYTVCELDGFECHEFKFEGRDAKVVLPKTPDKDGRWLLKTEYFGAFPAFQNEMLSRGYHVAYIANITRWMKPDDIDVKERFCEYLCKEYGLNQKCVPVGMSCGGLHAVYFAAKYPERIAALYLDAPVFNLLSCPMGLGKAHSGMAEEFFGATGMTLIDLINYRNHPIDQKEKLLAANIPVIMVYGDSDESVPYDENGAHFEKFYRERGGIIETYGKAGCGHHPHGLEDNTPIREFVEKYYV